MDEEASDYHTFTVPYGIRFRAKRMEKLCYKRDLSLNTEWNQPEQRTVHLHRHPAFFGRLDDVLNDCKYGTMATSNQIRRLTAERLRILSDTRNSRRKKGPRGTS